MPHFLFQFSAFLSYQNGGVRSKTRISDILDIANIFSPTFINPTFRFSPIVKYENLDYKNPRLSNIRLFDIRIWSNTKTRMFKIRDFQTFVFSIFACSQISKLGFQKSEIYKHPSFRYSHIVKYENLEV